MNGIKYLSVFVLMGLALATSAQNFISQRGSIGVTLGSMGYSGRYSVKTSLGDYTSVGGSVFYSYKVLPKRLSVRGDITFGGLKGDNRELLESSGAQGFFKANILEASAKAEFDILDLKLNRVTPYAFAGAGVYTLFGYSSTDGDLPSSKKVGFVVPVGGGVKYRVNNRVRLFVEGNLRFFNKNLDNVQSENNSNKYYSASLGVSYSLQKPGVLW